MLDTLKLAKRLTDARMPAEQAEALADALAQGLQERYITRDHLDARLASLRTELVMWIVGTVGLGTFVNHLWR
jgi:hypothetical protein